MPELPEVETIVRGIKKNLIGKKISKVNCIFKPIISQEYKDFEKLVVGKVIKEVIRIGKYIFIVLENDQAIAGHLRMTGQLLFLPNKYMVDKHTHLEFYFTGDSNKMVYRDLRKFGRFFVFHKDSIAEYINNKIAIDALEISSKDFEKNISKKKTSLKAALLDQKVIAGVGNIYADEICYAMKMSPYKPVNTLTKIEIKQLLKTIKVVLQEAIDRKGTSLADYVDFYGEEGDNQNFLKVHHRKDNACLVCGEKIIKEKVAGRGTYYCKNCQKL